MTGRTPPTLERALTSADVQHEPIEFLTGLRDRFGDISRYLVDGRPVVYLDRPEYARHVLQERHRNYAKSGTPDMYMLRPMLGDGLLTTDGEEWLWQRRLTAPSFHRSAVESSIGLMVEETGATVESWERFAATGDAFEVGDELTQLTTRVVARALFGADVSHLIQSFGDAVQAMNEFMGHYDPTDQTRRQRFFDARALIDRIVGDIIRQRRDADAQPHDDFLSTLLDARTGAGCPLEARSVRDQVLTLLMAGHETTAKTLTWALYLLDRHPAELDRVLDEIERELGDADPDASRLARMERTWNVLQETMRLYPPVWIISRVALEDDEIDGWAIPKGTLVLVSPYMLQRHPAVWERPAEFDPDRFVGSRADTIPPFAYFPFSGGPRQCVGKPFASLEIHLALAMILRRWKVGVLDGHPVEAEALITLRPRFGMPVLLEPRGTAGGGGT